MVYELTVDGMEFKTESDRDIRYAIIGRVRAPVTGAGSMQSPGSSLAPDSVLETIPGPSPGGIAPPPGVRQVLGWCSTRDEAEVSLQTLFRQQLFSDLEIVTVPAR